MTLHKCIELINILTAQIEDPKISIEDKQFNKIWIKELKNSISSSIENSIKKSEKNYVV